MGDLFQPWHVIVLFIMPVVWAIIVIPFWQIFKKAGLAPALSLLMLVPGVNLVMLYVLAFSRWSSPYSPLTSK